MWRVSQKEKFRGFHLKSFTIEGQSPANAVANAVAKGLINQLLRVAVRSRLQIIPI